MKIYQIALSLVIAGSVSVAGVAQAQEDSARGVANKIQSALKTLNAKKGACKKVAAYFKKNATIIDAAALSESEIDSIGEIIDTCFGNSDEIIAQMENAGALIYGDDFDDGDDEDFDDDFGDDFDDFAQGASMFSSPARSKGAPPASTPLAGPTGGSSSSASNDEWPLNNEPESGIM